MIISIIGFMGCGKSSVGRKLSELLCCDFMDLDDHIEKKAGRTIPEIFAEEGEAAFRAMERDALNDILSENHDSRKKVLALGGGTVTNPECAEMIRENTLCIYLRASVETLEENLKNETQGRPMLNSSQGMQLRQRIEDLMKLRSDIYESTAHVIIDSDGHTIDNIAETIVLNHNDVHNR